MKAALIVLAAFVVILLSTVGIAILSGGMTIFGAQLGGEVDRLSLSGREKSDINTATNSLGSQARFEQLYADVRAADERVDTMSAALKRDPDSVVSQTNLTGAINFCVTARNDYNALARTEKAEQFRSADLPYQLDSITIDCKENAA